MIVAIIFVLSILQVLQLPVKVKSQLSEPIYQKTLAENYPWYAVIKATFNCNGVLISPDYVMLPAECVNGSSTATVSLGFQSNPVYQLNQQDSNAQEIKSTQILVHKDFKDVNGFGYHNNIALVKLVVPAKLTHTVQPGILARDATQLVEGQSVNLPVRNLRYPDNLYMINVNILNHSTCIDVLKTKYFKDQELCFKAQIQNSSFYLLGNSVCLDKRIIGFLTKSYADNFMYSVALNIVPYINWISTHTNIDKATLTGDHCQLLRNTLTSQENIVLKLEKNITSINKLLTESSVYQNTFEGRLKKIETAEMRMKQMLIYISQKVSDTQQNTININKLLTDSTVKQNAFEERLRGRIKTSEINMKQTSVDISQQVADISRQVKDMRQEVADLRNKTRCLAGGFFLST